MEKYDNLGVNGKGEIVKHFKKAINSLLNGKNREVCQKIK